MSDDSKILKWNDALKNCNPSSVTNFANNAEQSLQNLSKRFSGPLTSTSTGNWDDKVKTGIEERAKLIGDNISKFKEPIENMKKIEPAVNNLKESCASFVNQYNRVNNLEDALYSGSLGTTAYEETEKSLRIEKQNLRKIRKQAIEAANAILSITGGTALNVPTEEATNQYSNLLVTEGDRSSTNDDNGKDKNNSNENSTPLNVALETVSVGDTVVINDITGIVIELDERKVISTSKNINNKIIYETFENAIKLGENRESTVLTVVSNGKSRDIQVFIPKEVDTYMVYTDVKQIPNGTKTYEKSPGHFVEVYKVYDPNNGNKTSFEVKWIKNYYNKSNNEINNYFDIRDLRTSSVKEILGNDLPKNIPIIYGGKTLYLVEDKEKKYLEYRWEEYSTDDMSVPITNIERFEVPSEGNIEKLQKQLEKYFYP